VNTDDSTKMVQKRTREHGFTLVEVTLAILIVGIGLLSVYGLFPSSLRMSKNAIDDTEASFFAEEVFNGLHARIDYDPTAWADPSKVVLEAIVYSMWDDTIVNGLEVKSTGADEFKTLVYYQWGKQIIERSIQYNLVFGPLAGSTSIGYARLRVRMGQYGTNITDTFYTEFYDRGMRRPN
jgi:prepilin-type N-terminal cleavage/methylation domain-containing protein